MDKKTLTISTAIFLKDIVQDEINKTEDFMEKANLDDDDQEVEGNRLIALDKALGELISIMDDIRK